ncbi:MAG TPA: nucleoside hydrolase [Candidatus Acidoferrum sp.]|nr:nucleoside hydrolase [Candidatus Acidoferrum sp.]
MTRTLLIDTDGGSDDVVALIMALRSPAVRVAAITVIAGNVPVEQATRNVLYTVELRGAQTPVYAGAAKPLLRDLVTAEWFHGKDGLGDHGYAPASREQESAHAVDAIIETVLANPGMEIVTLGPLTNLALAIGREPRISKAIGRCIVMGGAPCCEGNVTPAAEFNIWVDPEAAKMVFRAGLPIEVVGWHLCRGMAALNEKDIEKIRALKTPVAEFALRCNSVAAEAYRVQTGEAGISLPDPIAMAIALQPGLCTSSSMHYVDVETASGLARGMTVVDRLNVAGDERNKGQWEWAIKAQVKARVCWTLNIDGWKAALRAALA